MRINFLVCGTQKGGTSALTAYLRQHPGILMATRKEVHFFDNDRNFATSEPDYAGYHAGFTACSPGKIMGEATPNYMYWADAPRRIRDYNPAMKIIVMLRNPIERAYSHWNMQRLRRVDRLPFATALAAEEARRLAARPQQDPNYSYVDRGFYTVQLQRLWTLFPKEQVLILRSEELRMQAAKTLAATFSFLDVPPLELPELVRHQLLYVRPMGLRARQHLQTVFTPEIRLLEHLLAWDCSAWLHGA